MNKTTLVIMAAGMGSRYGGLKQVDPVGPNDEIIMDYSIYDAVKAGFEKAVIIIKRENESVFREKAGKKIEKQIDVEYAFQELGDLPKGFEVPEGRQKPWGTAHAVLSCRKKVNTPFAVINADDFYGREAFIVIQRHLSSASTDSPVYDFSMVGYTLENTLTEYGHVSRGVCTSDERGYLKDIEEKTKIKKTGSGAEFYAGDDKWVPISPASLVSMNFWGFTPVVFKEIEERFPIFLKESMNNNIEKAEFYLPSLVDELIKEGKAGVRILKTNDRWHGVTYPEDKPEVKKAIAAMIKKGLYPENLSAG